MVQLVGKLTICEYTTYSKFYELFVIKESQTEIEFIQLELTVYHTNYELDAEPKRVQIKRFQRLIHHMIIIPMVYVLINSNKSVSPYFPTVYLRNISYENAKL